MITKLLVANRGEIAARIAKTAAAMGIATVGVFSEADRDAWFLQGFDEAVLLGPAPAADSYLNQDRILEVAAKTGADAIHPGYGFLAENAEFAQRVIDAQIAWVGPSPTAMREMGLKIRARQLAAEAGVPIIPGFDASQEPAEMKAAAERLGYPVMIKASAGGGGKGIRIANSVDEFDSALGDATEESRRAFGDSDMIIERYITRPRHIEVQVIGDSHGSVIHLGTRECSLQRRHQKVVEEAPASNLRTEAIAAITSAATLLAESIGYENAGTVEFVVDADTEDYFFLEMNTRLQVEHPVTEEVTELDLVELQLAVASGAPLAITQSDVEIVGHSFEARINAEDPSAGFFPQTGKVMAVETPDNVRWDSGVGPGSDISPHYDSMVAKLIVRGGDREEARQALVVGLEQLHFAGPLTNQGFIHWLIQRPEVIDGSVTTRFVDEVEIPQEDSLQEALGHATWLVADQHRETAGPWDSGLRLTPHERQPGTYLTRLGENHLVESEPSTAVTVATLGPTHVAVTLDGQTYSFETTPREQVWRSQAASEGGDSSAAVVAPFPGLITAVEVEPGQDVVKGDLLVTLEAMKMLHPVLAEGAGLVSKVEVKLGQIVENDTVLVRFENENEE